MQTVIDFLESNENHDFLALRIDDGAYCVGDALPCSRVWEDGDPTDETLEGTSCLRSEAAKYAPTYRGKYIYVVTGKSLYEGNDQGEVVVADCEVVAVFER